MMEQNPIFTTPAQALRGLLMLLIGGLLGALAVLVWQGARAAPVSEPSPETGFARDMIVHHNQAIEMALLVYNQGSDSVLKGIALDMLLTQQTQIGQMQGWLHVWNLPIAGTVLPMTWMGMPTSGLMPGMATSNQMAALRDSSGTAADRLFIQLMIPHHQSGIHMANAILSLTSIPAVRDLALSVVASQEREIKELDTLLAQLPA